MQLLCGREIETVFLTVTFVIKIIVENFVDISNRHDIEPLFIWFIYRCIARVRYYNYKSQY